MALEPSIVVKKTAHGTGRGPYTRRKTRAKEAVEPLTTSVKPSPEQKGKQDAALEQQSELDRALIDAVRRKNVRAARRALDDGADANAMEQAALCIASGDCNVIMVKTLISWGANPKASDADGVTALMWAAMYDRIENGKLLIENGANVNAVVTVGVHKGWNVRGYATKYGHLEFAKMLDARGGNGVST